MSLLVCGLITPEMLCGQSASNSVEYTEYIDLLTHADLVVIGTAVSTRDTGKRFKVEDKCHPGDCEGWITQFHVNLVLKGTNQTGNVSVFHYKQPSYSGRFCLMGPWLAKFKINEGITKELEGRGDIPDYLLFLTASKDGLFEPVSGQTNSIYSVREVWGLLGKPKEEKTQPTNSMYSSSAAELSQPDSRRSV
jgi:hypothetical protein